MRDTCPLDHTLMLAQGSNGYKYTPLALSRSADSERQTYQILTSDQAIAVLDNELYSLDSRIFKREITPVISYTSHVVLLLND